MTKPTPSKHPQGEADQGSPPSPRADTLLPVRRTVIPAARTLARSSYAAALLCAAGIALAGPASAEPAEGWPTAEPVSPLHAFGLIGGVSLLVLLVLAALVLGPGLARGEGVAPGVSPVEDQWLGGPRSTRELGPGSADQGDKPVESGGAGARW